MLDLSLSEAQLYKLLVDFFGREQVIPQMSVMAVCGGELPEKLAKSDLIEWARSHKCLFTVTDNDDRARLVIDFEAIEDDTVDAGKLEYQRTVEPILRACGVRYFTITSDEFREILKPSGNLDLFHYFKGRFEELGFNFGPT